jgi:uncharacterized membrane protein
MKLFGHPIHAVLVAFPIGLLSTSVIFDWVGWFTGDEQLTAVAFYMLVSGVAFGLAAALFGLLDWLGIRSATWAKGVGLWHGLGNLVVLILFGASLWLRWQGGGPEFASLTARYLSLAGAGLLLVTGWLGADLVYHFGIGVDLQAGASRHD